MGGGVLEHPAESGCSGIGFGQTRFLAQMLALEVSSGVAGRSLSAAFSAWTPASCLGRIGP